MIRLSGMKPKKLRFTAQYQVRSEKCIRAPFNSLVVGLACEPRAYFDGDEPTYESVTNAFWLWFTNLPEKERLDWLQRNHAELERVLRGREPMTEDFAPDDGGEAGPGAGKRRKKTS
jgi:hypothetical protein